MSNALGFGIVIVLYVCWILLAMRYSWPVAWLDWISPYFHFGPVEQGKSQGVFLLPALLGLWTAFVWYRKSMIGEA